MSINLKSLFSDAEACCLYSEAVTFSDSFLAFASYAEQDESLYPYWSVQSEKEKFIFIDTCFRNEGYDNERNYIINYKTEFWQYLAQNSEFSCLRSELIHFYIPEFTIYSILFLSGRNIISQNDLASKLILALVGCKSAKTYFSFVLQWMMTITNRCDGIHFPSFCTSIEGDVLYPMHLSIAAKIDELIEIPLSQ